MLALTPATAKMLFSGSSLALLLLSLLSSAALPSAARAAKYELGPRKGQIKNLVTFGDSYTDVVSILTQHCPNESVTDLHRWMQETMGHPGQHMPPGMHI